jgi:TetR/AcrR family transcriptional repressor of nem operon
MPRQKEFDREKVLVDAMMLFRDQGYESTSVQDLVERMGINRFSLYSTFKSKHNLFLAALDAYHNQVAIPFFDRLATSDEGLAIIEAVLLELVSRVKSGVSPNGCLICNSLAELGADADPRTTRIFERYLDRLEANFHAAILRAKRLGEVPEDVDASGHAKRLVAYSTGLLSVAKVMSERKLRQSVRVAVSAIA